MTWVDPAVIVVKTVVLLLGGGITYIAYEAYRGTGAASLRMLAAGFGTVTLGSLLAGSPTNYSPSRWRWASSSTASSSPSGSRSSCTRCTSNGGEPGSAGEVRESVRLTPSRRRTRYTMDVRPSGVVLYAPWPAVTA